MNFTPSRRQFMRESSLGGLGILAALLSPPSWAEWLAQQSSEAQAAFHVRNPDSVYRILKLPTPQPSERIIIDAPDVAENGANVPVEVRMTLPNPRRVLLIAERNLFPLLADIQLSPLNEPWLETRVKLAETSQLRVIVETADGWYTQTRQVKVIVGGCLPG